MTTALTTSLQPYSLACRLRLALDIPDLSSTRSRDLTRHEMNHLSVLLVSALVFDDEPSPGLAPDWREID